jgi:hypothetical protein
MRTRRTLRGHLSKIYAMHWGSESRCVINTIDVPYFRTRARPPATLRCSRPRRAWIRLAGSRCAVAEPSGDTSQKFTPCIGRQTAGLIWLQLSFGSPDRGFDYGLQTDINFCINALKANCFDFKPKLTIAVSCLKTIKIGPYIIEIAARF